MENQTTARVLSS